MADGSLREVYTERAKCRNHLTTLFVLDHQGFERRSVVLDIEFELGWDRSITESGNPQRLSTTCCRQPSWQPLRILDLRGVLDQLEPDGLRHILGGCVVEPKAACHRPHHLTESINKIVPGTLITGSCPGQEFSVRTFRHRRMVRISTSTLPWLCLPGANANEIRSCDKPWVRLHSNGLGLREGNRRGHPLIYPLMKPNHQIPRCERVRNQTHAGNDKRVS